MNYLQHINQLGQVTHADFDDSIIERDPYLDLQNPDDDIPYNDLYTVAQMRGLDMKNINPLFLISGIVFGIYIFNRMKK